MTHRLYPRLKTDTPVNVHLSEANRDQWQLKDRSEQGFFIQTNAQSHQLLDVGVVALVSIDGNNGEQSQSFVTEVVRMTEHGVGCRIIDQL